jgi:hypothetical protein
MKAVSQTSQLRSGQSHAVPQNALTWTLLDPSSRLAAGNPRHDYAFGSFLRNFEQYAA